MPNNKTTKKDSQVERFVKEHPGYQDFFENYPIPESKVTSDPYYEIFIQDVQNKEQKLQEKAELYYLSDTLNKELEKKNPNVYKELTSKYGWNEDKPLSPKTRLTGAEEYSKKNPNFYLSPEEQKKTLGENWDKYVNLRGKYGNELNLIGEGDDPTKPEQWKIGSRHAVAFNPIKYTDIIKPKTDTQNNKNVSTFERTEQYDPTSEDLFKTKTYYSSTNTGDTSKNVSKTYIKRLSKVVPSYNGKTQVSTEDGIVFKNPGWKFHKVYDDGTKEEISENDYMTMRKFNDLPSHIKNKYVEEIESTK
jgi:hypothetical protein